MFKVGIFYNVLKIKQMEHELKKCLDVEAVRDKLQFRDVESC